MKILYGVGADQPVFQGMEARAVADRLVATGSDGVFLKTLEVSWVEALQAVGLKVFASFAVFSDSEGLWERLPESRPVTAMGQPAPQEEWYRPLLPSHPDLHYYRLEQLENLANSLPLDGIWLDFIRWPARWEKAQPVLYQSSFDDLTLNRFQIQSGVSIPANYRSRAVDSARWVLANAEELWTDWRCRQIEAFVGSASMAIRRHLPQAMLGLFTVPWIGGSAEQLGVSNPHIQILGQDPQRLAHLVDVLSPMVYHRLCGHSYSWVRKVTDQVRIWAEDQAQVWPIVELLDEPTVYPPAEFGQICREALVSSGTGIMLFKADGLLADADKLSLWRNLAL